MSTKTTTRRPGAKPRSLGILALVASMSLALAGLVGLGLAPAASADTPAECPASSGNTVWVLEGDTCVGTTTTPVNPIPGPTTYTCPATFTAMGWTSPQVGGEAPAEGSCVKTTEVDKVTTYTCPSDYSAEGWTAPQVGGNKPPKDSCVKYEYEHEDECESADISTVNGGESEECKPHKKTKDPISTSACPSVDEVLVQGGRGGHRECGQHPSKPEKCIVTEYADPIATPSEVCPVLTDEPTDGPSASAVNPQPVTCPPTITVEERTATCPVAGDVLTNGQCITPPGTTTTTTNNPPPGGYTCEQVNTCVKPAPVVQAATVAPVLAPAAATVAVPAPAKAPAKKPVKVPAPGSVSAGVAGSAAGVSAPAAATVPSAVPAGDGSQAPVLPVWALALIAVGVIGAAAAGKQLMGSQK